MFLLQQINQITHWLDSSNVYGSTEEDKRKLRTFRNGLLRSHTDSNGEEFLHQNRDAECIGGSSTKCFLAGITVFKNQLFTKVNAPKNRVSHENHYIKRSSHLQLFRSINLDL